MGHGHQPGAGRKELFQLVEDDLAAVVDGCHPQHRSALLAEQLPGDDVRVMLQLGDEDLVAGSDVSPSPARRHEVDGLGGAADEDDLLGARGVEEAAHRLPRSLPRCRGFLGERVHAALRRWRSTRRSRRRWRPSPPAASGWRRRCRGRREAGLVPFAPGLENPPAPDPGRRRGRPFRVPEGPRESSHLTPACRTISPLAGRAKRNSSRSLRTGSTLMRSTMSLAKAQVSRLRAASSPMPRERR